MRGCMKDEKNVGREERERERERENSFNIFSRVSRQPKKEGVEKMESN